MSVTFTLTRTTKVRASFFAPTHLNSTSSYNRLRIYNGSANENNTIAASAVTVVGGNEQTAAIWGEITLSAGTHTIAAGFYTIAGTMTLSASATQRMLLTVDVVG